MFLHLFAEFIIFMFTFLDFSFLRNLKFLPNRKLFYFFELKLFFPLRNKWICS